MLHTESQRGILVEMQRTQSAVLRLVVPGKPVSANFRTTAVVIGNKVRVLKSSDARAFQERVRNIAFAECLRARWAFPANPVVTIDAYGTRIDVDNLAKYALDGLRTLAFKDDRDIVALTIRKHKDGESRLEITVTEDRADG